MWLLTSPFLVTRVCSVGLVFSLQSVRTKQNNLTSLADPNWPITTDLRHLSFTANNITAKLTNQCTQTGLSTLTDNNLSLDSDDDFRSGCRNVSHHYQQQSISGLHSPRQSNYTITCYHWVQTFYCKSSTVSFTAAAQFFCEIATRERLQQKIKWTLSNP